MLQQYLQYSQGVLVIQTTSSQVFVCTMQYIHNELFPSKQPGIFLQDITNSFSSYIIKHDYRLYNTLLWVLHKLNQQWLNPNNVKCTESNFFILCNHLAQFYSYRILFIEFYSHSFIHIVLFILFIQNLFLNVLEKTTKNTNVQKKKWNEIKFLYRCSQRILFDLK